MYIVLYSIPSYAILSYSMQKYWEVLFSAGWGTKEAQNVFSHTAGAWDESQGGKRVGKSGTADFVVAHPPSLLKKNYR